MKPFILLLKIQLLGLFGINKTLHADPAKAKRTLALAALVVAAVVLFASAYSAGVAQGLVQIGLAEAVPLVAVLVGAIAGAVAAFLKTRRLPGCRRSGSRAWRCPSCWRRFCPWPRPSCWRC